MLSIMASLDAPLHHSLPILVNNATHRHCKFSVCGELRKRDGNARWRTSSAACHLDLCRISPSGSRHCKSSACSKLRMRDSSCLRWRTSSRCHLNFCQSSPSGSRLSTSSLCGEFRMRDDLVKWRMSSGSDLGFCPTSPSSCRQCKSSICSALMIMKRPVRCGTSSIDIGFASPTGQCRLSACSALGMRGDSMRGGMSSRSCFDLCQTSRLGLTQRKVSVCRELRKGDDGLIQSTNGVCEGGKMESSELQGDAGTDAGLEERSKQEEFVRWFRMAWPYIQGHRSSIFVIVLPGEMVADPVKINGVLQDILLLHGLGIKLVIIPGTQVQIDQLLVERGHKPHYEGAYRVTDAEALAASMEAAGRVRIDIEAKLSRGPSIPILRHREEGKGQWHEVAVASSNYLAAKRRGVVAGVDFGATGEVKRIDNVRLREELAKDCIVMVSNLGYSSSGEVLNCNTYEVATACAISLQADKLLVLLDGPIRDHNGRKMSFMTLGEADQLIRNLAGQSLAAAEYVKAVAGPDYAESLGIPVGNSSSKTGVAVNGKRKNGATQRKKNGCAASSAIIFDQKSTIGGFAIGGEERLSRQNGYISELVAAVYACRNGVGRVQLLDSNVQGALLLELYTRDGIGTMVSNDSYEGTRPATHADIRSIRQLLKPLEKSGILVVRPRKQLEKEVNNYFVMERDGSIIACAALFPHFEEKSGEVASFAVSPECQGNGLGHTLLEYIEKKAEELNLEALFLLTTRTADWFVQRGFSECTVELIPKDRQLKINFARGSKYYAKNLTHGAALSMKSMNGDRSVRLERLPVRQ